MAAQRVVRDETLMELAMDEGPGIMEYREALRPIREGRPRGDLESLTLLQRAAKNGYAPAQYALATWYLRGTGTGKGVRKVYARTRNLRAVMVRPRFPPE